MTSFKEPSPDSDRARLEGNARLFHFDADLEHVADLMDAGDVDAWTKLPLIVQDRGGLYADARAAYRRAVAAGAIPPDDRGPTAA